MGTEHCDAGRRKKAKKMKLNLQRLEGLVAPGNALQSAKLLPTLSCATRAVLIGLWYRRRRSSEQMVEAECWEEFWVCEDAARWLCLGRAGERKWLQYITACSDQKDNR